MSNSKLVLLIAVVCLAVPILSCGGCLILGAAINAIDSSTDEPADQAGTQHGDPETQQAPIAPLPQVTMANFNRIRTGMTYVQVVEILGEPSEQLSETEIAGQRSAMFQWNASNWMGNMNITFSNGTVMAKAQFGLE